MRVGIFGGSFDPIHQGHIAIARAALGSGCIDEVWLMVSPENPLKAGLRKAPFVDRLEMARLAVSAAESDCDGIKGRIKVSDFEEHMPKPSYTIATLRELRANNPECSFRLIIGGDNLERFSCWRAPQEILSDYGIIVYPRPGAMIEDVSKILSGFVVNESDCVILRDVDLMDVSSSRIRDDLKAGRSPEGVTQEVALYIKENGIYGES